MGKVKHHQLKKEYNSFKSWPFWAAMRSLTHYVEDKLQCPFQAKCIVKRKTSPLDEGEIVNVQAMAPEDECTHEIFVEIIWQERELAVPLSQLEAISANKKTLEAIGDWHYWVARGYKY